jgi:hypothetical protein
MMRLGGQAFLMTNKYALTQTCCTIGKKQSANRSETCRTLTHPDAISEVPTDSAVTTDNDATVIIFMNAITSVCSSALST